jgi:predicted nucleic acid-binding protein
VSEAAERLFDTTALVDIYRGRASLKNRFDAILSGDELACISVVTEAELWHGMRLEEMERHELLLSQFLALPVDSTVARLAGAWMQRYGGLGLGWMDALIVATAKAADLPVLTRDRKLAAVLAAEAEFELYDS